MAEPKRDRWGRYILTDPGHPNDEHPWTRATTLAGALDDEYGLTKWKMRAVILGLVSQTDLLDLAYASDPDDKEQLDSLADDAIKASGADQKSNQGTALHKFTARLDAGELSRSPRQWEPDLTAYEAFKKEKGILTHPSYIERITVIPELGVAGTMDRIVKHEGEPKIADLKTGKVEHGGMKMSMQLALYAHGTGLWDMEHGRWLPMPKVSQTEGLIMHLPAGQHKPALYRVNLELGWQMAQVAYQVREWRRDKGLLIEDGVDIDEH
jgi:hypothetical protein